MIELDSRVTLDGKPGTVVIDATNSVRVELDDGEEVIVDPGELVEIPGPRPQRIERYLGLRRWTPKARFILIEDDGDMLRCMFWLGTYRSAGRARRGAARWGGRVWDRVDQRVVEAT